MLELKKIFLIVRFFNWILCNQGLKANISCFSLCFFCLSFLRLESAKIRKMALFLVSHTLNKYKNLHPRSFWVKWKQSVCSTALLRSNTFYNFFLPNFVLEIFKFKYDKLSIRHSASISIFKWFEQPCTIWVVF